MPAAAVIPAPVAYIKVAAVKKLVVGCLTKTCGPLYECVSCITLPFSRATPLCLTAWRGAYGFYFEEIRVITAGACLAYTSMG